MALTKVSSQNFKLLKTKFENRESANNLKDVPLEKVFFHAYKCYFYKFCFSGSTPVQVTTLIFLPPIITSLVISIRYSETGYFFVLTELFPTNTSLFTPSILNNLS